MNKWLLAILSFVLALGVAHAVSEDELLEPDQAFALSTNLRDDGTLIATWTIAKGYYLYKDKFHFSAEGATLGTAQYPPGKIKEDEFFGRVEIYYDTVSVAVPYTPEPGATRITLTAGSQGCAEDRVCYPPHTQTAHIDLTATTTPDVIATPAADAVPLDKADTASPLDALKSFAGGVASSEEDYLDPDVAFQLLVEPDGQGNLRAQWQIAEGYYLYKSKISFKADADSGVQLGEPVMPAGKRKHDEFFGDIEVYYGTLNVTVPITSTGTADTVNLSVGYQGCAEAGICYPPIIKTIPVKLSGVTSPQQAATTPPPSTVEPTAPADPGPPVSEQDKLAKLLTDSPLWLSMLIFFGLGIGLAFTPCVFPMIPILSSIIVGQGSQLTTRRAFSLSLAYVLAMALTYTAAGVFAGLFGANLQAAFQNPWVLGSFATVFVLLSLSMFGFYELQMPNFLQSKLTELSNRQEGGTLMGVAIMGFLSALIVGPCVAAPLAGALLVIGQTGDAMLGGGALFALSMGMGAPLLAIGTSAGRLLPRAGDWMNAIKAVFGVLLLAVAIWMLERVVPAAAAMFMWASLLIVSGIYMGAMEPLSIEASGWRKLWKGAGLVMVVYGILLMVGAASGGRDVLQPLQGAFSVSGTGASEEHLRFTRVKNLDELDRAIAEASAAGKPVMLDYYADWCVTCKEMEKYTFSSPGVINTLSGTVILQADVTANNADDKALMKHFGVIGPPSILFFGKDGEERLSARVVGFMSAELFEAHARQAIQ